MFDAKTDLLALDFDGVIADSIRECLVMGYNAYVEYCGKGDKVEQLEEIEENRRSESQRLRRFIRSGEDYVYINHALAQNVAIANQEEFDAFKKKHLALLDEFLQIFYSERIRFSQQKSDEWIRLNPLYPGMKDFLSSFPIKKNLYVVTTKKISFVTQILAGHNIALPKENLFQATEKQDKRAIIAAIMEQRDKQPGQIYFIDDQIDTLIKVADLGIHCILARWGYNNEQQIERAKKAGIPVMELEEFYATFKTVG